MALRTVLIVLLLALASPARGADVTEARIGIGEYFRTTHPGAPRGRMDIPLVLVAASPDRLISRTGGSVEEPLSGEALVAQVRASLGEAGFGNAALKTLLPAAKGADGRAIDPASIRYPAVILIRLEHAPTTPDGTPLNADRDDLWETALRRAQAEGGFSLVVVSLDVSE